MEDSIPAVGETMLYVKLRDHRVLLRPDVFAFDERKAVFLRRADDLVDDEFLHPTFQHTAAHQKFIDEQRNHCRVFRERQRK